MRTEGRYPDVDAHAAGRVERALPSSVATFEDLHGPVGDEGRIGRHRDGDHRVCVLAEPDRRADRGHGGLRRRGCAPDREAVGEQYVLLRKRVDVDRGRT